jgi:hypothetical protein
MPGRRQTSITITAAAAVVFLVVFNQTEPRTATADAAAQVPVYFSGCNAARAADAAPIYEGQPGYRSEMDGDSDGIACEPYRGR